MSSYTYLQPIVVSWRSRIAEGQAFIIELHSNMPSVRIEYGPMAPEIVDAFIAERRVYFKALRDDALKHLITKGSA